MAAASSPSLDHFQQPCSQYIARDWTKDPTDVKSWQATSREVKGLVQRSDGKLVCGGGEAYVWDYPQHASTKTISFNPGKLCRVTSLCELEDGTLAVGTGEGSGVKGYMKGSRWVVGAILTLPMLVAKGARAAAEGALLKPTDDVPSSATSEMMPGSTQIWKRSKEQYAEIGLSWPGDCLDLTLLTQGRLACRMSSSKGIRIVDLGTKSVTTELRGHTESIRALTKLADRRLVSSAEDQTIRIWSENMDGSHITLPSRGVTVTALAVLDDRSLASGDQKGMIGLWQPDGPSFAFVKELPGHKGEILCLAPMRQGLLASGSADQAISIWTNQGVSVRSDGQPLGRHEGKVVSLLELHDGALASADDKGYMRIWDGVKTGKGADPLVQIRAARQEEVDKARQEMTKERIRQVRLFYESTVDIRQEEEKKFRVVVQSKFDEMSRDLLKQQRALYQRAVDEAMAERGKFTGVESCSFDEAEKIGDLVHQRHGESLRQQLVDLQQENGFRNQIAHLQDKLLDRLEARQQQIEADVVEVQAKLQGVEANQAPLVAQYQLQQQILLEQRSLASPLEVRRFYTKMEQVFGGKLISGILLAAGLIKREETGGEKFVRFGAKAVGAAIKTIPFMAGVGDIVETFVEEVGTELGKLTVQVVEKVGEWVEKQAEGAANKMGEKFFETVGENVPTVADGGLALWEETGFGMGKMCERISNSIYRLSEAEKLAEYASRAVAQCYRGYIENNRLSERQAERAGERAGVVMYEFIAAGGLLKAQGRSFDEKVALLAMRTYYVGAGKVGYRQGGVFAEAVSV